jgi:hypothetical protein
MTILLNAPRLVKVYFIWVVILLVVNPSLFAQVFYYQNLRDTELRACEGNPDIERLVPKLARIYQTIDESPFGQLDSSICPGIINNRIDLSTIRPGMLFVEVVIPESERQWVPGNSLFHLIAPFHGQGIQYGTALLKIDHEEIQFDQSSSTWYEAISTQYFDDAFQCVRIENFEHASPNTLIFSILVENTTSSSPPIFVNYAALESVTFLDHRVLDISFSENEAFNGGFKGYLPYLVQTFEPNNLFGNYYITHPDIQDARRGVLFYFDLKAPPRLEKDTLTVLIGDEAMLYIHPYVTLRSDFIFLGSEDRHVVQFVQDGDFCIPPFVDLVVEEGVYYFQSGHLELSGQGACILLRKNSTLQIADHTNLDYGRGGVGMLGLSGASQLVLGKNAHLSIDNQLALIYEEDVDEMSKVVLKKGQSLSFGPNASIRDMNSPLQNLVLQVLMEGGILDIEHLDPISRQHIQLIYPSPSSSLKENIKVLQDPLLGRYYLEWIASQQFDSHCTIIDLHGRLIDQFVLPRGDGWQTHEFSLLNQVAGIFILVVESNNQIAYHKLLKF